MTVSDPAAWFVTYTRSPSGATATPYGFSPTAIVAVTTCACVSMIDTELLPELAT